MMSFLFDNERIMRVFSVRHHRVTRRWSDRRLSPWTPRGGGLARTTLCRTRGAVIVAALLATTACHGLLEVSDPTLVQDKDIANAAGANARRLDVSLQFIQAAMVAAADVAVFTDERTVDQPANYASLDQDGYLDSRNSEGFEAFFTSTTSADDPHLGNLDKIFTRAAVAIPAIRANTPDSLKGDFLAQLYALRGYVAVQAAEDICPGFPLNDIVDDLPAYGVPLTTDSAITYAITQLDTALMYGQDSARFVHLAHVVKGRALLDLGQYEQAAQAVAAVPTDFAYSTDGSQRNNVFAIAHFYWDSQSGCCNWQTAVGDREGVNGLPFVSAQDPRAGSIFEQVRYSHPADSLYDQTKYQLYDPMVVAGGIEARLIEAEAALNAGDPSWLATLNTLRSSAITPAMAPLTDPGTADARVDLLYRERAFWLYLTGRRLGDLRRLIRNYHRDPETLFPKGAYPLMGLTYGRATAIPFIQASEARFNSHVTSGCTTR